MITIFIVLAVIVIIITTGVICVIKSLNQDHMDQGYPPSED